MVTKKISMIYLSVFLLLFLFGCDTSSSDGINCEIFMTDASIYNGKRYKIGVVLPSDYGVSEDPYPVLYTMDGEELMYKLGGILEEQKKRVILVAVYNMGDINRSEDNGYPGIEKYAKFITKELAPLIEKRYNIDPDNRTILGQSWTGVGVSYIAFLEPPESRYFQSYISIDGAYIDSEINQIDSIAATLKNQFNSLFVSIKLRSASDGMWELGEKFYDQISQYTFNDYSVTFSIVPDTYHGLSVVLPVFSDHIQIYSEVNE